MSKKIKGLGSQGVETSFDLEPKHPNSSKTPMIFFRKQIYLENAELTDAVFGTPPYKATYIQKDLRGRLKFFSKKELKTLLNPVNLTLKSILK